MSGDFISQKSFGAEQVVDECTVYVPHLFVVPCLLDESVATSSMHETGAWPLDMHNYDLQQLLGSLR